MELEHANKFIKAHSAPTPAHLLAGEGRESDGIWM